MKAFIAGIITLSLLIGAVVLSTVYIMKKTDKLIAALEALPSSCEKADLSDFANCWEESRKWINLTIHRESIDEIDDTLDQLNLYCKTGNGDAYLSAKEKLLCITKRLRKTESFSLSRIF